jgi:probable rRNA maturation factor
MQVTITYEHKEELFSDIDLEGLVKFVLTYQKCPANTDVSLSFVTDEKIHELNRDYRGIDRPTDVLSFECDNVPFEGEVFDNALEYELGDIIIAPDVALRQTEEFNTTFAEEITLLVVHGLLHLCGYDHIEDKEAEIMESLEDEIIKAWKLHHE